MKPSRSTSSNGRGVYGSRQGMQARRSGQDGEDISLLSVLWQLFAGLKRLLVALQYQLFRRRSGGRQLPWFKIAIAFLLLWMAMKRDMQFQINLKKPGAESGAMPVKSEREGQGLLAAARNGLGLDLLGPKDYFADEADDTAEERRDKSYIRRFKEVAIAEMEKSGMPASVKMAQALIESQAGTSKLATRNNNHFGIKCFSKSCKKGHCSNFSDDHHKDFFRNYTSAWESWRSHTHLITQGKYKALLKYGRDYKAWARGLKEMGYATDKRYDEKVIDYIERYHLKELDR